MNIGIFILCYVILGIIGMIMVTNIAKRKIEETEKIEKCEDEDLALTANKIAEAESRRGYDIMGKLLIFPTLVLIVGIALWPFIIPLVIFGWNHYTEL